MRDGLPHPSVTALAEGPDGRLWVGTRTGLAVFDGYRFADISLPVSLQSTSIASLSATEDGRVWVGVANRGVVRISASGQVSEPLLRSSSLRDVATGGSRIAAVDASTVYVRSARVDSFQAHPVPYAVRPPAMLSDDPHGGAGLYDVDVSPDGTVWVLDGFLGPGRVRDNGHIAFLGLEAPTDRLWQSLAVTDDGRLLATCRDERRLVIIDPETRERETLITGLRGRLDVFATGETAFVSDVRGFRGVDVRTKRIRRPLGTNQGLPPHHPTTILKDRTQTLWIGTQTGLLQVPAPAIRHVTRIEGRDVLNPNRFMSSSPRELWVQTYGSGLLQLRPLRRMRTPSGQHGWGQGVDSATDTLHALSRTGWYRHTPDQSWKRVDSAAGAVRGVVGASGIGVFWHDDGLYRHRPSAPDQAEPLVTWDPASRGHYAVGQSPKGTVVLRTPEAVVEMEPSSVPPQIDTIANVSETSESRGRYLSVGPERQIWIPFQTGGLLHIDASSTPARRSMHLEGKGVESTTVASDSLLLVASRSGLYGLHPKTGAQHFHLTGVDGLLSTDVKAATVFGDSLYVSHATGFTVMPKAPVLRPTAVPPAAITSVTTAGTSRPLPDTLHVPPGPPPIAVQYAAPYLRNPQRVDFQTRLLPDTSWYTTRQTRQIYQALDAGTYRFEVRARMGDNTGTPASLVLVVAPTLLERTWVWVFGALGLLGLCAVAMRWQAHRMAAQQQALEDTIETRTQELREEKRKTERQAAHLAKLDASKNRFFANLSHEFRTPLTLILGPLNALLENPRLPDASRYDLTLMKRSVERLQGLIDQLLDLSRLEAGRMDIQREPVDLVAFSKTLVESFAPLAESGSITLRFKADADHFPASVDPVHIEKILSNLLSNALKFTPEDGRVWVLLHRASSTEQRIAQWVVKDTGPGIEQDELARIFDRFEQVDGTATRAHGGTGIGLSLTQELVHLHDGTIGVESDVGQGTAFTVRIPIEPVSDVDAVSPGVGHHETQGHSHVGGASPPSTARPDAPDMEAPLNADSSADGRPTLLIVDDNADARAFLRRSLTSYQVCEATTGREALRVMRQAPPDLIVCDVMMPDMDGFAFCEAVRSEDALHTIPILLLTARAETEDIEEGLGKGADDYLTKPFDIRELKSRLSRLLTSHRDLKDVFSRTLHVEAADVTIEDVDEAFMTTVLEAIEESLSDPDFTVDDLASAAALSRRQLTRRLRDLTGETPGAFIRRIRLERAADHLEDGPPGTIAEVAYSVGFRSPSHFSTAFKKRYGCSPSRYSA